MINLFWINLIELPSKSEKNLNVSICTSIYQCIKIFKRESIYLANHQWAYTVSGTVLGTRSDKKLILTLPVGCLKTELKYSSSIEQWLFLPGCVLGIVQGAGWVDIRA